MLPTRSIRSNTARDPQGALHWLGAALLLAALLLAPRAFAAEPDFIPPEGLLPLPQAARHRVARAGSRAR
jgi:hypothetical protein